MSFALSTALMRYPTYDEVVLGDNPVAYVRMSESAGTTAKDWGRNAFDFTNTNSPTQGNAGPLLRGQHGGSYGFGTNKLVTRADTNALDLLELYTHEIWVNLNGAARDNYVVAEKGANLLLQVQSRNSTSDDVVGGHGGAIFAGATSYASGWHHWLFLNTGSVNRFYHNNAQEGGDQTIADGTANANAINIGVRPASTAPWPGLLAEWAAYGYQLTVGQIMSHFLAATQRFSSGDYRR